MNKKQYEEAISLIGVLMDSDPDPKTLRGRILKLLVDLAFEYEEEKYSGKKKPKNKKKSKK